MNRSPIKAGAYRFDITAGGDWVIRYGLSGFLVAEGAGWSRSTGMNLYRKLESDSRKHGRSWPFKKKVGA